jgi:hypothetical protein
MRRNIMNNSNNPIKSNKLKWFVVGFVSASLLSGITIYSASQIVMKELPDLKFYINNELKTFKADLIPLKRVDNGRVYLSARAVGELLGKNVEYKNGSVYMTDAIDGVGNENIIDETESDIKTPVLENENAGKTDNVAEKIGFLVLKKSDNYVKTKVSDMDMINYNDKMYVRMGSVNSKVFKLKKQEVLFTNNTNEFAIVSEGKKDIIFSIICTNKNSLVLFGVAYIEYDLVKTYME